MIGISISIAQPQTRRSVVGKEMPIEGAGSDAKRYVPATSSCAAHSLLLGRHADYAWTS